MQNPKLLIVVVVVAVAGLFIAAVIIMRNRDEDQRAGDRSQDAREGKAFPDALQDVLPDGASVARGDLEFYDCGQRRAPDGTLELSFGGDCTIEVGPSDESMRLLFLVTHHDLDLEYEMHAGDEDIDVESEPRLSADETEKTITVPIGKHDEETDVDLDCEAEGNCLVEVIAD